MALSEYEKQVLAQMEAQLKEADPSLASVMTSSLPEETDVVPTGRLSPRRIALGSIIGVGGLAIIIAGVSFGYGWVAALLGVLGFACMVGGVLLALKSDPVGDADGSRADSGSKRKRKDKDFMSRQRSKWDERGPRAQ
ncbi:DUF3040 domain-containing protein [Scrofimicrobium sp. R131]|uniref:DUF3040 domain-containing protein n=1 Tax=Scrofimicrobium appendicitidis TaxID=3079930 RepID=A0AAU7V5S3_9ACTO